MDNKEKLDREITCIGCPSSCRIWVTGTMEEPEFAGYTCKRGLEHAKNELYRPMRMLTSTVKLTGGKFRVMPVISTKEVPKDKMSDCLEQIYRVEAAAPVQEGDVIISNICGTGADIVAARSMRAADQD